MNLRELKQTLINLLYKRGDYIRQVNEVEYVTRCPYCGDSVNPNTGHFYIRINPNDNQIIKYNCFKCPAGGYATSSTFEELGLIIGSELKQSINYMNKTSEKVDKSAIQSVYDAKKVKFKIPEISHNNEKLNYVRNRIGYSIPLEDAEKIKIITSLKDFLYLNNIDKISCKPNFALMLEKQYVGFLTNDNYILFRDITETSKIRWFKYKILKNYESQNGLIFHSISSQIDIMTTEKITINICEGSLDILSILYNLGQDKENTMNIAMSGKYHISILNYLVGLGIAGSNVVINIWSDADHRYKPQVIDTRMEYYKKILNKFKFIFGEINVIYNIKKKDFGYPKEDIELKKSRI